MSTTTSPVAGKVGQGLDFDGVNDYVSLASNPLSNLSSPSSACAWILTTDNNHSYGGYTQRILTLYTDSNNYVGLRVSSGYFGAIYKAGGTDYGKYKTGTISNNIWYHVCYVWNGSGISLYVNGINLSGLTALSQSSPENVIGGRTSNTGNWLGYIDDIRLYSRALLQSEIIQLYNTGH